MPRATLIALLLAVCIAIGGGALLVLGSDEDTPDASAQDEPTQPTTYNVVLRGPTANHDELAEPFAALPGVTEVEYVSRTEAIDLLQAELDNANVADAISELNANPLPAIYVVGFEDFVDGSEAKALLAAAAGENRGLIEEISLGDIRG